jgi:transcriptional regulator with XRE-family HTH domain
VVTALRRARVERGESLRVVADALDWSEAKISRIETAVTRVSITDLKALLDHYELFDPLRSELICLARARKERAWWDDFRPHYPPEFIRFVGIEASAAKVMQYQLLYVPGLLQTAEYTRAVVTDPGVDEDGVEREIRLRDKRQERLREGRAEFDFVLDESVLRRQVSGHATWLGQLRRLIEFAELPTVSLRILTFDAGLVPNMTNSFELFQLAEGDEASALLVERPERDVLTIGHEPRVASYATTFRHLSQAALPPGDSLEFVRTLHRSTDR